MGGGGQRCVWSFEVIRVGESELKAKWFLKSWNVGIDKY
jgi:hypothetical protein